MLAKKENLAYLERINRELIGKVEAMQHRVSLGQTCSTVRKNGLNWIA